MLIKLHVAIANLVYDLQNREEGQTLVEYGLILAFVAVVCIGVLTGLGNKLIDLINSVITKL